MTPQSIIHNLQCTILGACLLEPNAFERINDILYPDLLQPNFAKVYAAMQTQHDALKPINIIYITKAMSATLDEQKKHFAALAYMTNMVCSTANLEHDCICLFEQVYKQKAIAALPNPKTLHNLELAQEIIEISEALHEPNSDILEILPTSAKKLEVYYPNDLHPCKAFIQLSRDMSHDIFQIKENLTKKGWYGAAKISMQNDLSTQSAVEMHQPSAELRYDKSKKVSTINEQPPRAYNRKPPIEVQKDIPF
jgi:hypothetical protein